MARKPISEKRSANLTIDQKRVAIGRLSRRLADLKNFDIGAIEKMADPNVIALEHSISKTLRDVFGADTLEYDRYRRAFMLDRIGPTFGADIDVGEIQSAFREGILESRATIEAIISGFNEDIAEVAGSLEENSRAPLRQAPTNSNRQVFIVHGRDDAAKQEVARFLSHMEFEPVILHEQPNKSRALIEKFEAYGDVGFAVVLLTPDDMGTLASETSGLRPRARQNVVFELGYFIGILGRDRVCALKRGELEEPSDYAGVIYLPLDQGDGWKLSLAKELKAAGFEVDATKLI